MDNCTASAIHRSEVIAYHGWGFAASCWHDWRVQFEQQGWQFKAFDRGYWQQPVRPTFNPLARIKLLMVHSYGLHLCPIQQLQQADIVVIFSSFAQFHPASDSLKRRSQQMLQQMIDQFRQHPQQVLQHFQMKCYQPNTYQETFSAAFDLELLLHDLNHLQTTAIDLMTLQITPQYMIFHGIQDRIVSFHRSVELVAKLSGYDSSKYESRDISERTFVESFACQPKKLSAVQHELIEAAGHALPFTHFDYCWSKVNACLEYVLKQ